MLTRLTIFIKMKNLAIREFVFSLVAAFDEFFFWLTKKRADKYKYIRTEKINFSSVKYKLLFNGSNRQSATTFILATLQLQMT